MNTRVATSTRIFKRIFVKMSTEVDLPAQIQLLHRIATTLDDLAHRLAQPPVPKMLYRIEDLTCATGLDRRKISRERAAGRFPQPTMKLDRTPLWSHETIQSWIASGGRIAPAADGRSTRRPGRKD